MRSGNLEKAAQEYEKYITGYLILGNETLERWILAHHDLARIFEQMGQKEKAVEYYERFLRIWKDGDADLPILREAKNYLAALKK